MLLSRGGLLRGTGRTFISPAWSRSYASNRLINHHPIGFHSVVTRTNGLRSRWIERNYSQGANNVRIKEGIQKRGSANDPSGYSKPVITWTAVGVLAATAAVLVGYYQFKLRKRNEKKKSKPTGYGSPDIGGPFTMVDHNGRPVTDSSFRGRYMLIYFGFTFCPDICPAELDKVTMVLENLVEKQGVEEGLVVPVFVSLDPWRDSVAKVREYIKDFHPTMVALTGTPEQVNEMAAEFRVYSASTKREDEFGEDDDYLVDHSVYFYLMGPDGKFVNYFGSDYTVDKMARKLAEIVRSNEQKEAEEESFFSWVKGLVFTGSSSQ